MASIAMKAESVVPEVTVSTNELVFGDCYLRYAYKKVIELVNHSNLPAKFELQPQDEISRCVAKYEVDYPKGVIDPFQQRVVTVSFSTERLDKVQLPMFFRVVGHDADPLEVQCIANGIGPNLTVTPPQLKWGDIQVLKDVEKTLKVKNESLVPAYFGVLVMKRGSRFRVNVSDVTLGASETVNIKVAANLDDVQNFKDDLCLVVTEGGELTIPLTARGIGTTITCPEYELGAEPRVSLESQFTCRACKRSIVLTNEGPKPQILSWVNGTAMAAASALRQAAAKEDDKKKKSSKESEPVEVFRVEVNGSSEPFTLEPAASCTLDIVGMSRKAGLISEKLCCRNKADKDQRVIIEMHVSADFVDPLCELSHSFLNFEYNHNIEVHSGGIPQYSLPVTLKNICSLPLECSMKCSGAPFSIDCNDVDLKPGESATMQVMFDPGYKSDKISEIVKQSVSINYNIGPSVRPACDRATPGLHPKKGNVDLTGVINYPNLKFDKTDLKFGAVLNDTTKRLKVKCTNTSSILTIFTWSFVVPDDGKKRPGSSKSDTALSLKSDPSLPINSVFDILPIRSSLLPGQSEEVEFVFFGHANHKYKAIAVCTVQGGPEYEIKLEGEASSIQYKFDRLALDYGNVMYDKFSNEDLVLHNTGKVKFDFNILSDSIAAPTVIRAVPQSATVQPNDKIKIQIQFYPGMPAAVSCSFAVEVAHFDPQQIKVTGKVRAPHLGP
jgi:hydrocephalus-inducing protein